MIWILLIIFQLKHFIADFPLQTPYMLGKFKAKGWIAPLACHCGVQSAFTYLIALFALPKEPRFAGYALLLALLDFWIHFTMDRIKASPEMLGRYKVLSANDFGLLNQGLQNAQLGVPYDEARAHLYKRQIKENKYFWWALGLDQMVHHLTDILIVFLIVKLAV